MGGQGSKIAIAVGVFVLAGIIYYSTSGPEKPEVVTESMMVDIICEACGEVSQDTPENLAKVEIRGGIRPAAEGEGLVRRTAKERTLYPCPKCSEPAAVAARYCEEHQKHFPAQNADGSPGRCPDCP